MCTIKATCTQKNVIFKIQTQQKEKHTWGTPVHQNRDGDSDSLCGRERGVVRLQPLFSEVEISLEEISKKLETIYV